MQISNISNTTIRLPDGVFLPSGKSISITDDVALQLLSSNQYKDKLRSNEEQTKVKKDTKVATSSNKCPYCNKELTARNKRFHGEACKENK